MTVAYLMEERADTVTREFMAHLDHDESLTYSVAFTVTGTVSVAAVDSGEPGMTR